MIRLRSLSLVGVATLVLAAFVLGGSPVSAQTPKPGGTLTLTLREDLTLDVE